MVWHPIMSTVETRPGCFVLQDGFDRPVAQIDFIRRGPDVGYRAERFVAGEANELVGYFTTLLSATKAAHLRVVSTYAHQGGPIAYRYS